MIDYFFDRLFLAFLLHEIYGVIQNSYYFMAALIVLLLSVLVLNTFAFYSFIMIFIIMRRQNLCNQCFCFRKDFIEMIFSF